jgi:serine protease Do/serine protease DegQ
MSTFRRALAAALLVASVVSAPFADAQIPVAVGENHEVPSLAPLLRRITPSVVSIAIRRRMTEEELAMMNDPILQDPLGLPVPQGERTIYAAGSGVVIDAEQGFIVTGAHVVEGADEIVVILSDGGRLPATTVGVDGETDIAVVKVRPRNLTSMQMGDSDRIEVGDFVLAIGNPFSIGQTVTSGIVSALRKRSWGTTGYEDFIQTDAAINLGSSGGALVNLRGELVGMNAAILDAGGGMGGNVGIGFAIPVNTVRNIAGQLTKYGSASHGQLGVAVSVPVDRGLPSTDPGRSRVVVKEVEAWSSAARAGVKVGDIITALNSSPLRDAADLHIKTGLLRVGDMVELNILREGRSLTVRTTLTAPPSKKVTVKGESLGSLRGSVASRY